MTTNVATACLTSEEVAKAEDYLLATREDFLRGISGLSKEQRQFRPAPDRWSIAEVLEHVVVVEQRVGERIRSLAGAEPTAEGRNDAEIEAFIINAASTRANRVKAPSIVEPCGRWEFDEAVEHFLDVRKTTLGLLATAPHLRGRVFPHPLFGLWDGYQWILAAGAHTTRHLDQINEIKAHPQFPNGSARQTQQ